MDIEEKKANRLDTPMTDEEHQTLHDFMRRVNENDPLFESIEFHGMPGEFEALHDRRGRPRLSH